MVLACDLWEDRRTIDVIVTKSKMAETFENLDNILRDWAKNKGQKRLAEALNRSEMQEEERWSRFLQKNDPGKIIEQSQSAVERD